MKINAGATSIPTAFWWALGLNFIWINASEVVRYFGLIKPMLHEAFPKVDNIAIISPSIFASWMFWDTILILAAAGFYWMFFKQFGATAKNAILSSIAFTITIIGLIWIGIVNMGLAPSKFIWVALPLAWIEQVVAAFIVFWAIKRK
ncbi:MAG: hypothetical protein ABJP34_01715 [Erythrobacter sp.]